MATATTLPPLVMATHATSTSASHNPAVYAGVAEAHNFVRPAAPHTSGVVFTPYLTAPQSRPALQPSEGRRACPGRALRELVTQVDGLILGAGGESMGATAPLPFISRKAGSPCVLLEVDGVQGGGAVPLPLSRGGVVWSERPGCEAPPQHSPGPRHPQVCGRAAQGSDTCPV